MGSFSPDYPDGFSAHVNIWIFLGVYDVLTIPWSGADESTETIPRGTRSNAGLLCETGVWTI